jgi:hypothetical protein
MTLMKDRSKIYNLKGSFYAFYCARLENLISAARQSLQQFGTAKPFAIVAHRGQLF